MTEKKQPLTPAYFLGFDGGGTKTDCYLVDAEGKVLHHATAGPSNPLRAGYAKAWFTLSDAADFVLERQHLKASDIRGICAGIGGAGRDSVAKRIATFLDRAFPQAAVQVTTDLAITLLLWAATRKERLRAPAGAGHGSAMKAVRSILDAARSQQLFVQTKVAVRRPRYLTKC
jgi:N-acetylglucosamine kinase-like BadF-type ATPase